MYISHRSIVGFIPQGDMLHHPARCSYPALEPVPTAFHSVAGTIRVPSFHAVRRQDRQTNPACSAHVLATQSTVIKRPVPLHNSHQHSLEQDEDELALRRLSHAQSSTSASALPPLQHRSGHQQHAKAASGPAVSSPEGHSLPQLLGPPRLAPAATEHVGPPPLAPDRPTRPVFSAGRRPRLPDSARQASASSSRAAQLGRALLQLPPGASPGEVLQGEMLSSKQITG
jgi:hypothetical protein